MRRVDQPNRGDFVAEMVPGARADMRFRVRRYASALDIDKYFADEATAIAHAVEMASIARCTAFLKTDDGWRPLERRATA